MGSPSDARGSRRGHGRAAGRALVEGLPLALAQQRRACPGEGRPRGAGRRRRARRGGRAGGGAPRGVRLAVPRRARDGVGGRMGSGDARGPEARQPARRRRVPRQGRLARGTVDLRPHPRRERPDSARLAVAADRARRAARGARAALEDRRRLSPPRLPQGVHGRDARLADRLDARRQRRAHHERRRARRADPRRRGGGLARWCPRDRRPREPRGSRRLRGDERGVAAARPPSADRACPVPGSRRRPTLRGARRRRVGPVQPCAFRPRPRGAVLAGPARRDVRVPLAPGERRGRRQRVGRARRGARSAGWPPRGRAAHPRRPARLARRAGALRRAGAPRERLSRRRGSPVTSAAAGSCSRASSPTSSSSTATRLRVRPRS